MIQASPSFLWATQGNMRIEGLSPGTKTTIQDALGAQVAGPGAEILEKRIADTYSGIFTQTGKLRGGAGADRLRGGSGRDKEIR